MVQEPQGQEQQEQGGEHRSSLETGTDIAPGVVRVLEWLDDAAHVVVAAFLLVLAVSVLLYAAVLFGREAVHFMGVLSGPTPADNAADPVIHASLEFFSTILFVVIMLELLRTVITFVRSHSIVAIMKDFLVVGMISIVRRILLVGAESSLSGEHGREFVQNSLGVLVSLVGVLILVGALVWIKRTYADNKDNL